MECAKQKNLPREGEGGEPGGFLSLLWIRQNPEKHLLMISRWGQVTD